MRKFRTAALAVATASTVALAGTTVASADTTTPNVLGELVKQTDNVSTAGSTDKIDPDGSLEMDQDADGQQLFGSSTGTWGSADNPIPGSDISGQNAKDRHHIPVWAQLVYGSALAGVIALAAAPLAGFVSAPTIAVPNINLPAINLPAINLPGITGGNITLPNINFQDITLPCFAFPAAPTAATATGSSVVWKDIVIKVPEIVWH